MEYTVVGTQVNLAARLVTVAERDMVDVERVGPLTVKGFQRPITAYNVLGMKDVRRV